METGDDEFFVILAVSPAPCEPCIANDYAFDDSVRYLTMLFSKICRFAAPVLQSCGVVQGNLLALHIAISPLSLLLGTDDGDAPSCEGNEPWPDHRRLATSENHTVKLSSYLSHPAADAGVGLGASVDDHGLPRLVMFAKTCPGVAPLTFHTRPSLTTEKITKEPSARTAWQPELQRQHQIRLFGELMEANVALARAGASQPET